MNERFWQLVEQADDEGGDDPDIRDEVFAELIIRECASLAHDDYDDILEHFGVKE